MARGRFTGQLIEITLFHNVLPRQRWTFISLDAGTRDQLGCLSQLALEAVAAILLGHDSSPICSFQTEHSSQLRTLEEVLTVDFALSALSEFDLQVPDDVFGVGGNFVGELGHDGEAVRFLPGARSHCLEQR